MPSKKTPKKRILPRSKNGTRRKSIYFPAYGYERESLHVEARRRGMSTSLYLNVNFWPAHHPPEKKKR